MYCAVLGIIYSPTFGQAFDTPLPLAQCIDIHYAICRWEKKRKRNENEKEKEKKNEREKKIEIKRERKKEKNIN